MTNEGIETVQAAGYGPPPGGGGYGPPGGQPPGGYGPPPGGGGFPPGGGPPGYGAPPGGAFGPPPGGFGQPGGGYPMQPGFAPVPKTNGLAITSMVLGILGACGVACYGAGGLLGILAIIFGAVARKQIADSQGQQAGKGMATAGLVLGIIVVGLGVLAMVSCLGIIAASSVAGATGAP